MRDGAVPLRIVHVLGNVAMRGSGIVNVAVDLACVQSDLGHEVWVASEGGAFEALLAQHGVHHVVIAQRRSPSSLRRALASFKSLFGDIRPDIVHAHMMTAALLVRTVRGRRFGLVTTVHNSWQRGSSVMMLGDRVIAVSEAVAHELRGRRLPARQVRVVMNGPLASPRSDFGDNGHRPDLVRPSIVTVAGMYERKGIADLIDAFALVRRSHPSTHLYLVGNGPERESFEERARAAGLSECVHFERFQPRPQDYLRQADVFVLASHKDPNPLVIPEARYQGCAIVASDAGGIVEALDGGEAGRVFPARDVGALAEALADVLADPTERARLQLAARNGIEWLTVERMVADTVEVYRELL